MSAGQSVLPHAGGTNELAMADNKYRLITRSDFDGLVCAVLLKEIDLIGDIKFVHPKDMQDGTILRMGPSAIPISPPTFLT